MSAKSFCGDFARIKRGCFFVGIDSDKLRKHRATNLKPAFTLHSSFFPINLDKCSIKNSRYYYYSATFY